MNLRKDQRWITAISAAAMAAPVLIDSLTLMVPFSSDHEKYASIDQSWRVSIGSSFWGLNRHQQNFILIHLCMHMLSRQFQRAVSANIPLDDDCLGAMSLEIDPQISSMDNVSAPDGYVYPQGKYKRFRTMEEYYHIISSGKNDGNGSASSPSNSMGNQSEQSSSLPPLSNNADNNNGEDESSSKTNENNDDDDDDKDESSSGDTNSGNEQQEDDIDASSDYEPAQNTSGDDDSPSQGERTPADVSNEANAEGIERPSPLDVVNTMKATAQRARGGSSFGLGTADYLEKMIVQNMQAPKTNWRIVLSRIISLSRNRKSFQSTERTFSKINVRASAFLGDIIMPGLTSYAPKIIMGIDTSGSMANDDIMLALNESEGIIRTGSGSNDFSVFCIDTKMKDIQPVSKIQDLDITGGGGTDMAPAFEYISSLSAYNRPDVFVLATDGFVPWEHCKRFMPAWNCMIIILIVDRKGLERIPAWLKSSADIIDISA